MGRRDNNQTAKFKLCRSSNLKVFEQKMTFFVITFNWTLKDNNKTWSFDLASHLEFRILTMDLNIDFQQFNFTNRHWGKLN